MEELKERETVQPIKIGVREGRNDYLYKFDKVHLDEVDLDKVDISGLSLRYTHGSYQAIVWSYKDKPDVYIEEEDVKADKANLESRRQAYYALSILDDHGWVSGFRRIGNV